MKRQFGKPKPNHAFHVFKWEEGRTTAKILGLPGGNGRWYLVPQEAVARGWGLTPGEQKSIYTELRGQVGYTTRKEACEMSEDGVVWRLQRWREILRGQFWERLQSW